MIKYYTRACNFYYGDISKKKVGDVKIVVNGAGASAIACANLFKKIGIKELNCPEKPPILAIYRRILVILGSKFLL